eukprot:694351-Pyramimonas_sp.AAC.1
MAKRGGRSHGRPELYPPPAHGGQGGPARLQHHAPPRRTSDSCRSSGRGREHHHLRGVRPP